MKRSHTSGHIWERKQIFPVWCLGDGSRQKKSPGGKIPFRRRSSCDTQKPQAASNWCASAWCPSWTCPGWGLQQGDGSSPVASLWAVQAGSHAVSYCSVLEASRATPACAGVAAPSRNDGKVTPGPSTMLIVLGFLTQLGQREVGGRGTMPVGVTVV